MQIVEHAKGLVPGPGLYRMSPDLYHSDPAPQPSLSSSIAKTIITYSPEHAWAAHPRLGKKSEAARDPSRPMEIGTVAHKLILGQGADVVVIDHSDYKTNAAKAERAAAYEAGNAPILRPDCEKAESLAKRFTERLASISGCEGFASAEAEVVAIVQDKSGAWLRIMMDKLEIGPAGITIWDVKSGDVAAAPPGLGRRIEQMGMDVQAALYIRVMETLFPRYAGRVRFCWGFIENDEPHGLCVADADSVGLTIGARKVAAAVSIWTRAISTKTWPSYPAEIVRVAYPEWAAKRWIEREQSDPLLAEVAYDNGAPAEQGDAA